MSIENTSRRYNAKRNIVFGGIQRVHHVLFPFLIRTVMIYTLGIEYLGLNSLFASILQVLNLTELGIGSAMVYSMYKPIAENDTETICALMQLYKKCYRIIGAIIAVAGLAIVPFINVFVKGSIPDDVDLAVLYLLNLAATVLSYWLFAYRNCLLVAHQRTDISSKVTIVVNTVQFALQIAVLVFLKNYYIYLILLLVGQIAINVITAIVSQKLFPLYTPKGNIDHAILLDIKKRVSALFISKIGGVVLGSADTIIISAFLGLTSLAIYQNYFFIVSSIYGTVEIILNSITAGLGNSLISETEAKNINDFKNISFSFSWLICICVCCFTVAAQPFMEIWAGKSNVLPFGMVICFALYFIAFEYSRLFNVYKNAAGSWYNDRFRPLVSAILNLILNLSTVRVLGLYGISLSTVVALSIVEIPWLIYSVYHDVFTPTYEKEYVSCFLKEVFVTLISCAFASAANLIFIENIFVTMVVRLLAGLFISFFFYWLFFHRTGVYKTSTLMIKDVLKRKQ